MGGVVSGATLIAVTWTTDDQPHWSGRAFPASGRAELEAMPQNPPSARTEFRDAPAALPRIYGLAGTAGPASASSPAPALRPAALPAPASRFAAGRIGFHELVMLEKARMRAIWDRALAQSPTVREYAKEWRATPELAALTARWHRDYDPIAFLKGLAVEPKFFQLLGKYGRSPDMLSVLKQDVSGASPQALSEATRVMSSEPVVKQILDGASRTVGLPLGLLVGTAAPTQDDVLKAMLQNPHLQASAMAQLPQPR